MPTFLATEDGKGLLSTETNVGLVLDEGGGPPTPAAPAWQFDTPGGGVVGTPFSYAMHATGYPAATYAVTSGAVPAGLALNATTGVLSGTPTTAATYTFQVTATNTGGTDVTPTITIIVAASGGGGGGGGGLGPSGIPVPIGDIVISGRAFTQVVVEDFTVDASTGSWGTDDPSEVVYTGEHGAEWNEYPDGWSSTNTGGAPGYQPAVVLSVHDSVLDFSLQDVAGQASGANPSPILDNGSGNVYTSGGVFAFCMRSDAVAGYHMAPLLWPSDDGAWQSAESDFPEADLTDSEISAFAHYGGTGAQDEFDKSLSIGAWHVYKQVWIPGVSRSYYVDDVLIGTSTHSVYSGDQRWQLQIEPSDVGSGGTGHLEIDWVVVYVPT